MSRYKPYPAYKDSGVEWLGCLPEHWQLRRLKHMASFTGGGTPSRDNPAFWNGTIPWVSPKDMKSERISATEETITSEGLGGSSSSLVPAGRVLLVVRSGILRHTIPVAINDVPIALNQDMKAIWFDPNYMTESFFMRWVQGLNDDLLKAWLKQGATVESIEQEYLGNCWMVVPPIVERDRILAVIDRETARIDAMIKKKTRFIELLREKRQALITHAVTKGLDPNVKMKDSGVKWLGEVPEHWDCSLFKQKCSKITDGAHISPETVDGVYFFVSTKDLAEDRINFEIALLTSVNSYEYLVRTGCNPAEGDVLFSKDGTIGRTVVVRNAPNFVVASSLIIVRPDSKKMNSDFLNYFFQSKVVSSQVESLVRGAGLPRLSIQNLLKIIGAFPPLAEQKMIVDFINTETSRIRSLMQKTEHSITLLKERRAALITAAVTGQIDLRETA